jgi:CdiI N-terminal domain
VVVQEQLLWAEPLARSFDPANPYVAIGNRVSVAQAGQLVSEWRLDIADIEDFVATRSAQYLSV